MGASIENKNITSSIGGLWPPERSSFERVKGIYTPEIIQTKAQLLVLLDVFNKAVNSLSVETGLTRCSLRALINKELLSEVMQLLQPVIEAVIPLDSQFNGVLLVYLGHNHASRQPSNEDRIEQLQNIETAWQRPFINPFDSIQRVVDQGYSLSLLDSEFKEDPSILAQMDELYQRFGWSKAQVESILHNPSNIVTIASQAGQIVSAVIGEIASIPIGHQLLRMVEVTEAATKHDFQRRGLYAGISTQLLLEIARLSQLRQINDGEVDLVFGEINAQAPGALNVAVSQGRNFVLQTSQELGFPNAGILSQHVPISNGDKRTSYNDLLPAYLTRNELYQLYGQQI